MTMTGVQLFQLLKSKIGDRESDALITYVDNVKDDNNRDLHEKMLRTFATREDLAKAKGELEVKISDVKSDVLRWMFAFFITMILAILGLYLKK